MSLLFTTFDPAGELHSTALSREKLAVVQHYTLWLNRHKTLCDIAQDINVYLVAAKRIHWMGYHCDGIFTSLQRPARILLAGLSKLTTYDLLKTLSHEIGHALQWLEYFDMNSQIAEADAERRGNALLREYDQHLIKIVPTLEIRQS